MIVHTRGHPGLRRIANCDFDIINSARNETHSNQTMVKFHLQMEHNLESSKEYMCRTHLKTYLPKFNVPILNNFNPPHHIEMFKDERITCVTNSPSNCTYIWAKYGDVISHNRILEIKSPGRYRCRVKCSIEGIQCSIVALRVTYRGGWPNPIADDDSLLAGGYANPKSHHKIYTNGGWKNLPKKINSRIWRP